MPVAEKRIAEIDGLRAFAVLAVLLFHAFPTLVPGGFIGVDIFFVISGFVISRSYLFPLIERRATLADFYVRRVRRLAPAYVLVVAATTLAAFVFLEPRTLRNFSNSLLAQSFYFQNLTFWIEGDYFDGAITKPLLHTWSLAVEEQFYLLLGAGVLVLRRWPKVLVPALLAATALSIVLGVFISGSSPKTSFFLLPTRVWEFAFGILAYLSCRASTTSTGNWWSIGAIYVGLCALVASILLFPDVDTFPGLQAGIACTATAVMCGLFVARPSAAHRPFILQPICYIGRISYTLYLWHWPLIVFPSLALGRALAWPEALAALGVSLVVSAATYHYLELPVRRGTLLGSRRQLLVGLGLASGLFAVVGGIGVATSGAVFRYSEPVRSLLLAAQEDTPYRCGMLFRILNPTRETCERNQAAGTGGLLIVGDSHADMIDDMVGEVGAADGVPVYLTIRNCGLHDFGRRSDCNRGVFQKILSESTARGVKHALLVSYWHDPIDTASFEWPVSELVKAGVSPIFVEVAPYGRHFNPELKAQALMGLMPDYPVTFSLSEYEGEVAGQRAVFQHFAEEYPGMVEVIGPQEYLCNSVTCDFDTDGYPNYRDNHHLSHVGVARVRPMYEHLIAALAHPPRLFSPGNL